jgi:acyl-CoA thioesterase YciA
VTDTHVHAPECLETEPLGDLCIRTLAMPADTNANGDIFGGWLLSQMDLGGGVFASKIAKSRTVTVAIEAMNFRKGRRRYGCVIVAPRCRVSPAPPR